MRTQKPFRSFNIKTGIVLLVLAGACYMAWHRSNPTQAANQRVLTALQDAHAEAPCPTTPAQVAWFTIGLAGQLNLIPAEHPTSGGARPGSPTSLHDKDMAVDLMGPRNTLVAIDKALKSGLMKTYCVAESSVEENHLHLGFGTPPPG